jgi:CDP-diacylglycerol---glycerol-3-phosphate 3-phosphatidyltransferase
MEFEIDSLSVALVGINLMLTNWIRARAQKFLNAAAQGLGSLGFTPNALTLVGFAAMCAIGVVIAFGNFPLGGILIILAGILDGLDGSLARLTNRVTKFGAFLDSTTDRFAEGAIFLGILYSFLQRGQIWVAYLVFLALLGSLMVSYARARAEGINVECREGWLTRFERFAILVLGLILTAIFGDTALLVALGLIAVFANITAVQRIWFVYQATRA